MSGPAFKNKLIDCRQCGRKIMVRAADADRGQILCSHAGCGAVNDLAPVAPAGVAAYQYDESLALSLPGHGLLTYLGGGAPVVLPVRLGENIIGTDPSCTIPVSRYQHDGRCYISRRHCTLTVTFDQWLGTLRYQLRDGTLDPADQSLKPSLNGTWLGSERLHKTEVIDVPNGALITLGGLDRFQLTHQPINPVMQATYRIDITLNADQTQ